MVAIEVYPGSDLAYAAAEHIADLAAAAIRARGRFSVALSGGNTPRPVYECLGTAPFAWRIDWSKTHIFWGDERCVAPDDPNSNYRVVRQALLDHVSIPPGNIRRMRGEIEPHAAALEYTKVLEEFFGGSARRGPPSDGFDLMLLGMGDNGHTASLFPGMPAVHETAKWVTAEYVAAVSGWRITLTPVVINAAKHVAFLVAGAEKADRLREVIEGTYRPDVLPAQVVRPASGQVTWLVDEDAAAHLSEDEHATNA